MSIHIRHLLIIGTGLIGGSLALALRRQGVVKRITGVGRSLENLKDAVRLGVVDDYAQDVAQVATTADMVVMAVPVAAYPQVFQQLRPHLAEDAIITDVGSTKQSVIQAAKESGMDMSRFVPAHPIAGTEHSGAAAAFAELFEQHRCILTPTTETSDTAKITVKHMWEAVGAQVEIMDAGQHDHIMASISHLPHLAAFSMLNAVDADALRFAAGGFRDITRIASSSPEMWRDISLCNAGAIATQIDALQAELHILRQALKAQDGELLLQKFMTAKHTRDQWLCQYGDKV